MTARRLLLLSVVRPSLEYGSEISIFLLFKFDLLVIIRDVGFYHFINFVALNLPVSEIVHILPEAVYCCFSKTTLFTTIYTLSCGLFIVYQVSS